MINQHVREEQHLVMQILAGGRANKWLDITNESDRVIKSVNRMVAKGVLELDERCERVRLRHTPVNLVV